MTAHTDWSSTRAPLFDPDGSFAGYIGACFDVTEFRRTEKDAEASLRRKEMELKESQRLAGVGGWQWDPDRARLSGRIDERHDESMNGGLRQM